MARKKVSLHGAPKELLLAILVLFSLFCLLLTLVFVRIVVPGYRLTTGFRVAYNIVISVIATIIARYTASEIQKQWLRLINHQISNTKYQLTCDPGIAHRWRAVLGLSTFYEGIRTFKSSGLALLSTIPTALITAAIVAAVTLTDTVCVSAVYPPRIHSGADNRCMRNVPNNRTERFSPLWEFRTFWNRNDGSAYVATTNLGCPSWSGAQNLDSINTVNPQDFAYARNGVAVTNTAIGAPEILYTSFPKLALPNLDLPYGEYFIASHLESISHCLPIMAYNPVKCRVGGTVEAKSGVGPENTDSAVIFNAISVNAGGCNFTQAASEDPNGPFGIMVSRLCPTWNAIGQGTVAIGATGIISLTLAAALGDTAFIEANADKYDGIRNGTVKGVKYAASCSIDVRPTIRWRTLTLQLSSNGTLNSSPSYGKSVSGVDGCPRDPKLIADWNLGDAYAAGAVAALVPPLSEGRFWNGMTNTILNQALNTTETSDRYSTVESWRNLIRNAPYGFKKSTNALEDVLGLTAGITMSQMTTPNSMLPGSPLAESREFYPPVMGMATFACTRVGSGTYSALLFTAPALLALVMAVYLLCVVPVKKTQWKTSRLEDLIAIGMASERELNAAYKADHLRESAASAMSGMSGMSKFSALSDTEILTKVAAAPGYSQRWVIDDTGTHAIPVGKIEGSGHSMGMGSTTGLPRSPVLNRY